METEEFKAVDEVLQAFLNSENGQPWEPFDDNMCMLSWLTDAELFREVDLVYASHLQTIDTSTAIGGVAPIATILDAIKALLDQHENGAPLDAKTRYIFEYYLCLSYEEIWKD